MNKIISYGWDPELPIGKIVNNIHNEIINTVSKTYKNTVLIDTTWIGDANINKIYKQLYDIEIDAIVLCSLVDATFVTVNDFKQFDVEILSVGNFNEGNRIDFWSIALSERFVYKDSNLSSRIRYPFISYNNKPHLHRIQFMNELIDLDLIDVGAVSFHGDSIHSPEDYNKVSFEESGGGDTIINDTMSLGDMSIWNSSFINIVTETEFDPVTRCFYSEKTWKPIVGMRPFLHYASDNVNKELNEFGFKTFEKCFSDICNLDLSTFENIALFCKILSEQGQEYLSNKYKELLPMIKHNKKHFYDFVKKQNKNVSNINI